MRYLVASWAHRRSHPSGLATPRNAKSGPAISSSPVVIVPPAPRSARQLELRIERFLDPFPAAGRIATGPWAFRVALAKPE